MTSSPTPLDAGDAAFVDAAVGTWFVEGDPFEVTKSPAGGLLATGPGGPISAAWVLLRGIKGSPTPSPTPNNS